MIRIANEHIICDDTFLLIQMFTSEKNTRKKYFEYLNKHGLLTMQLPDFNLDVFCFLQIK